MFVDTTTCRAGARCVPRVNVDHFYPVESRLVQYLLLKTVKCPAMQGGSLRLPNRYPVTDTAQVFQGDPALSVLSLNQDAFTDAMVRVVGEALLLACKLAQTALGRLGAFDLQLASQVSMPMADVIDAAAFVDFSVAIYGNVNDATVNTQERLDLCWRWFVNLARRQQIPFPVMEPQVRLAFLMLEHFAFAISALT